MSIYFSEIMQADCLEVGLYLVSRMLFSVTPTIRLSVKYSDLEDWKYSFSLILEPFCAAATLGLYLIFSSSPATD